MDVGCCHDLVEMVVLKVGQALRDFRGVVVVDQSNDPHRFAFVVGDDLFEQGAPHQSANGFTTVRMPMKLAILVESLE
jgi:hypothetical protein